MNKLGFFGFIFFALLILAACAPKGIAKRQHTLRILDAETGAPVVGAAVSLHYYPSTPDAPEPNYPRAISNTQGEVTLPRENEMAIWQVQANGYIEQGLSSKEGALPPRYAAHSKGDLDGVIYIYRLPEPQLNIRVSDNYTGPLIIQLEPASGFDWIPVDEMNVAFAAIDPQASYIQKPAGRRLFETTASDEGVVKLKVAPLLYDLKKEQIQIFDGAGVLPFRDIANPQDLGRGVWGAVSEDEKRISHQIRLFVGTREDYLKYLAP